MATWLEDFDELSTKLQEQLGLWKAGARNHQEINAAMRAIEDFLRQYETSAQPERDTEKHTP